MDGDPLWQPSRPVIQEPTPAQRRRAVLAVAANASDATDLTRLLAMLGLAPQDARAEQADEAPPEHQGLSPKLLQELGELSEQARHRRAG